MNDACYAMVHFGRETDDEPPRAAVIYSSDDGCTWHDIVTCHPDTADQILEAFEGARAAVLERAAASRWWQTAETMRDLAGGLPCGCRGNPAEPCPRCANGALYDKTLAEQRAADGY